jgi:hypothetical protein
MDEHSASSPTDAIGPYDGARKDLGMIGDGDGQGRPALPREGTERQSLIAPWRGWSAVRVDP